MVVNRRDAHAYLVDKCRTIAPDDVFTLAERCDEIRSKAEPHHDRLPYLRDRVHLATELVRDYAEGECTNIPLYSFAIIAVALLYLLQDVDAVPDFLPGGFDDDDLILAVALEIARPGLERYCDSKGVDCSVLDSGKPVPKPTARATPKSKPKSKPKAKPQPRKRVR